MPPDKSLLSNMAQLSKSPNSGLINLIRLPTRTTGSSNNMWPSWVSRLVGWVISGEMEPTRTSNPACFMMCTNSTTLRK